MLYTNEAMTENIEYYSSIGYSETHRVEEKGLKAGLHGQDLGLTRTRSRRCLEYSSTGALSNKRGFGLRAM
jgi:hypothetical protein